MAIRGEPRTKVLLVGDDGITQHATGYINSDIVAERHIVERNGRLYGFEKFGANLATFRECLTPYLITEF